MEATQKQIDEEKAKLAERVEEAKSQLNPEQRSAVEQKELELKGTKCMAEIEAACKRYGFTLQVGPPNIQLVPVMTMKMPTPQPEK